MNGFVKGLTGILGVLAVIACLGTVGILGYSFLGWGKDNTANSAPKTNPETGLPEDQIVMAVMPTSTPESGQDATDSDEPVPTPISLAFDPSHVHDYQATVIKKATCMEAGQIKYVCKCGDSYIVDQMSTGHLGDEWVVTKQPTAFEDGEKVQKCIYCGEVIGREIIPATGSGTGTGADGSSNKPAHEHMYIATTEREPTCTLAGLRKLTCSCGSFYTEIIPATGHIAMDWEDTVESTADSYGTAERRCAECGALLDTKILPLASATPNPSASPSASAAPSGSPGASSTPAPTPTPHVHKYTSYIVTPATCTTKGVRSYVCSCGSSYAESIELDLNHHHFAATTVAPTETQQGYTVYTCTRCNYSYKDNYIMPLTNNSPEEESAGKESTGN